MGNDIYLPLCGSYMSFNVYFENDGGLWVESIEDNHISKFNFIEVKDKEDYYNRRKSPEQLRAALWCPLGEGVSEADIRGQFN